MEEDEIPKKTYQIQIEEGNARTHPTLRRSDKLIIRKGQDHELFPS